MANKEKKVYLVELKPGEYRRFNNWTDCQKVVHGKPYPFAGGRTEIEALAKLKAAKKGAQKRSDGGTAPAKSTKKTKTAGPRPTEGICSDAGTHGNPGPCEYQVTDLDGKILVHRDLGVHSNNYAELAGIGAMVKYAIEHNINKLWTDSTIAMGWIRTGRIGDTVHEREMIIRMSTIIRDLLKENRQLHLLKWDTKRWGQIPADFGRK